MLQRDLYLPLHLNLPEGLDAVVDKDLSAALLGRVIKANELWIITDVDQVCLNYGMDNEEGLSKITASVAKQYYSEGHFQAGLKMAFTVILLCHGCGNLR